MNPAPAQSEMREINRIFEEEVVLKGDFDALDRVYTADARILPPGAEMVSGREAIKGFWKAAVAAMGVTSGKLETVEAETAGERIIEIGRAQLTLGDGSTSHRQIRRCVEAGGWRLEVAHRRLERKRLKRFYR